ncbi:MAG TPA: CDP-diacylglycerol--glycerol-3-phosphate 3-phosphatidyltransferase [Methylomirabilota bacterium]|nr:CDP-diacylglycerol--glycerol-3-phosphate 3-phosphatidyltransferase [Methylomirabilota bacterium]
MGLPNWLTILRILLIPVFVTLLVYRRAGLALLVFCLASLTDMLDGYIARSQGRQTRLGAFLDPMADKLLLTSGFVTLTWLKVIPFWITAVVVSRDVVLSIGVLVIHVAGGTVHPAPTWIGKMSTLFQMLTVLVAMAAVYFQLLPAFVTTLLAWVTAAFTITSGLQYIIRGLKQLETHNSVSGRV